MKFTNTKRFFLLFNFFFFDVFFYRILSYFAKLNFISYDEWFNYDLAKNELDIKTKKTKNISNIHNFIFSDLIIELGPQKKLSIRDQSK